MKKLILLISILSIFNVSAQFENMFTSNGDANKYLSHYTAPVFNGFLYATGSSWFTSAKPLKKFHFQLNIAAAGALVPDDETRFNFNPAEYEYMHIDSGSDILPTVLGGDANSVLLIDVPAGANTHHVVKLDALSGVDLKSDFNIPVNVVPAPNIQLSMGLPLNSMVSVRYMPQLNSEGASIQLLGLGLMHSISQYFPQKKDENGKKEKRRLNLAFGAAFSSLSMEYVPENVTDYKFEASLNTYTLEGLASFDFKFLSLYGGFGYTGGNGNLDLKGSFDITYDVRDDNGVLIGTQTTPITDPLKLRYNIGGMKTKVGAQLNLYFFKIFADYTIQKYSVLNAGIAIKI